MHELTIALDILEIVRQAAEKNAVDHVYEVQLEVGMFSGIDFEVLQFALEITVKETPFEKTIFTINRISGTGKCRSCQEEFEMQDLFSVCPACKELPGSIIRGKELKVLSIVEE
jgi:hydrogenase nickel incorporation protein HypA/HybF